MSKLAPTEKGFFAYIDHSSIDHNIAGTTEDLNISSDHCGTLAKILRIDIQGQWIAADWDKKTADI